MHMYIFISQFCFRSFFLFLFAELPPSVTLQFRTDLIILRSGSITHTQKQTQTHQFRFRC